MVSTGTLRGEKVGRDAAGITGWRGSGFQALLARGRRSRGREYRRNDRPQRIINEAMPRHPRKTLEPAADDATLKCRPSRAPACPACRWLSSRTSSASGSSRAEVRPRAAAAVTPAAAFFAHLSGVARRRRLGALRQDVPAHVDALREHEDEHQPGSAEGLEVDPGRGREGVGDVRGRARPSTRRTRPTPRSAAATTAPGS